jgi:proline iminopeptidase
MATRTDLYPLVEPFDVRKVPVDDLHTLHVEQSGRPDGVPVVFLHGGPGSAWSPHVRRVFDPAHYRLVAFDQRGSWRSTPLGELRQNTPKHLIADMERLRAIFGIPRWIVFGGSWGSTLAIAYAEAHPERCLAVVARGVSLGLGLADGWYFKHSRWVRPEAWAQLMAVIPEAERHDPEAELVRRILDPDRAVHLPAILAWNEHARLSGTTRHPDPEIPPPQEDPEPVTVAGGRLAAVYMHRYPFVGADDLLANAHRLKGIPGAIIHGAEDFNCPPSNAWDLHQAWPEADYVIVPDAGHSFAEIGIRKALVAAMETLKGVR